MLRPTSTGISIITNFGCSKSCWYCVWKTHHLVKEKQETDWDKLEVFLRNNKHKQKVSVSGGGDPLYNYVNNTSWWEKLFALADKFGIMVDVHTREQLDNEDFWSRIHKCVFSVDSLYAHMPFLLKLNQWIKIRVCYVVTRYSSPEDIKGFASLCDYLAWEFTLKELVIYDDLGMYQNIKATQPNLYCLDAGDYNTYYMPNNTVTTSFMGV